MWIPSAESAVDLTNTWGRWSQYRTRFDEGKYLPHRPRYIDMALVISRGTEEEKSDLAVEALYALETHIRSKFVDGSGIEMVRTNSRVLIRMPCPLPDLSIGLRVFHSIEAVVASMDLSTHAVAFDFIQPCRHWFTDASLIDTKTRESKYENPSVDISLSATAAFVASAASAAAAAAAAPLRLKEETKKSSTKHRRSQATTKYYSANPPRSSRQPIRFKKRAAVKTPRPLSPSRSWSSLSGSRSRSRTPPRPSPHSKATLPAAKAAAILPKKKEQDDEKKESEVVSNPILSGSNFMEFATGDLVTIDYCHRIPFKEHKKASEIVAEIRQNPKTDAPYQLGIFVMMEVEKSYFYVCDFDDPSKQWILAPKFVRTMQRLSFRPLQKGVLEEKKSPLKQHRDEQERFINVHHQLMRRPGAIHLVAERRFQWAMTHHTILIDPARMSRNYVSRLVKMTLLGFRLGMVHLSLDKHLRVRHQVDMEKCYFQSPVYELMGVFSGLFALREDNVVQTVPIYLECKGKTMQSVLTTNTYSSARLVSNAEKKSSQLVPLTIISSLPQIVHFQFGNPGRNDYYARLTSAPHPSSVDFYGVPELSFPDTVKEQESGYSISETVRTFNPTIHHVVPPRLVSSMTHDDDPIEITSVQLTTNPLPEKAKREEKKKKIPSHMHQEEEGEHDSDFDDNGFDENGDD